jgi:hypothetical protein
VFGWPDLNTGFDQSEHALYTSNFIIFGSLFLDDKDPSYSKDLFFEKAVVEKHDI